MTNDTQSAIFSKLIKKTFYGKPNTIKILFPAGFAEVALREISTILNDLVVPQKFTSNIRQLDNSILIENIHFSAVMELLLRNHTFTDIHLIVLNKSASGIGAFKKRCEDVNWNFYFNKNMSTKVRVNSVASHAFHESQLKEILSDVLLPFVEVMTDSESEATTSLMGDLYKDRLTLSLSLAGTHLYKRGYRELLSKSAPLREDIAASCLKSALHFVTGLGKQFHAESLCAPFSGTGTFIFEHLIMAMHLAPGLLRHFSLEKMPLFHVEKFSFLAKKLLEKTRPINLTINGCDTSEAAIENSTKNYSNLLHKIDELTIDTSSINFTMALTNFFDCEYTNTENILLPINPPYGLRIHHKINITDLYKRIAIKINEINNSLQSNNKQLLGFILCPSEDTWVQFRNTLKLPHMHTYHFNQGGLDIRVCEFFSG